MSAPRSRALVVLALSALAAGCGGSGSRTEAEPRTPTGASTVHPAAPSRTIVLDPAWTGGLSSGRGTVTVTAASPKRLQIAIDLDDLDVRWYPVTLTIYGGGQLRADCEIVYNQAAQGAGRLEPLPVLVQARFPTPESISVVETSLARLSAAEAAAVWRGLKTMVGCGDA